jgi:hypothetical protein
MPPLNFIILEEPMRFFCLCLCSLYLFSCQLPGAMPDGIRKEPNDSLARLLRRMREADQEARNARPPEGADPVAFSRWIGKISTADSLHYPVLDSIFHAGGIPTPEAIGYPGLNDFFLLIQHQDGHRELQERVLAQMSGWIAKGGRPSPYYADLSDRVALASGKPQRFGTQVRLNADSTSFEPFSLEDPGRLDEFRESAGLEPIGKYVAFVNEHSSFVLKKAVPHQ